MRKVPKYPNYLITEDGRVWTIKNKHFMKGGINGSGYLCVVLDRKTFYVHHLVAMVYLKKPKGKFVIHHIDGNKLNNHYKNLEYITYSQNTREYWRKRKQNES